VKHLVGAGLVVAMLGLAGDAGAHIELMSPEPRTLELKVAPCGLGGLPRANINHFDPGQTIEVVWQETIGHPGHYRISFDDDGDDDFKDPRSFTDLNTAPSVMIDNIADRTGTQIYRQMLTLPDITCGNCTLQVIQVMTDKPPYGDGDDVYHQCADLVLGTPADAGVVPDGGVRADAGGGGGSAGGCGCAVATRGPSGGVAALLAASALALVLVLVLARKRR
jgi:Lytic polysaccharide mono-oxygenase, cellulose-degrading